MKSAIILCFTMFSLFCFDTKISSVNAACYSVPGDVNGDDKLGLDDIIYGLQVLSGMQIHPNFLDDYNGSTPRFYVSESLLSKIGQTWKLNVDFTGLEQDKALFLKPGSLFYFKPPLAVQNQVAEVAQQG